MNRLKELLNIRMLIILVIVLSVGIMGILYLNNKSNKDKDVDSIEIDDQINNGVDDESNINDSICIDIKGAVKNPGVYELESGARVITAIEKSGGLTKNADTSIINLSKKLEDGNVIIIYTKDKINELMQQEVIIEYIEKECECPEQSNTACLDKNEVIYEELVDSTNNSSKISLNKTTKEELITLPGIGESKADDILEYIKTNGKFKNIEDIKNVKGIGDALFNKIKEYITI